MAPVLGYWDIRGKGQSLRFILHYVGVEFDDRRYSNMEQWSKDKYKLGLEFPNLPYYIDGHLRLTETSAILLHLARKHNLTGSTEDERIRTDVAKSIIDELTMAFTKLCYSDKFETEKVEFIKNINGPLKKLSILLGTGEYIVPDKVTYVDFELFELLERYSALAPHSIKTYKHLDDFHTRMTELPPIREYISSPQFQAIKTFFFAPFAKFGAAHMKKYVTISITS